MSNIELGHEDRESIRAYLITTQGTQYEQVQQKDFLAFLSPSLKEQIAIDIFKKQIQKCKDLYG